ncbi:MFS transporter [Aspergillus brunneoviolaceus CBS 621.78]|uniref:MFS general substrate transporter n=1 Tax=Aspergillus brunneoviolaceus CBS 621.78 TaxID=1450534 RepID=A0ACD1G1T7_9EURO|nr:MFS general substrate transporter [Aspergillus brunneoviolaceus CBS 621.78]RAH43191.1 MFS general substrate transporter [Aspergillus brunneoviolaceus CBS 621.78]
MLYSIGCFLLLGTSDVRRIAGDVAHDWPGDGTRENPQIISWPPTDRLHARNLAAPRKTIIIVLSGLSTLSVAFASSAYSGDLSSVCEYFSVSKEAATLGLSLYVLGFAIGPLLWAPLGEAFGRRVLFLTTFSLFAVFNVAAAVAPNFGSLVAFRCLAGMFGSSPLTNSGGIVADLYSPETRGLAAVCYSGATFLGPVLGPIVGGFLGETRGWRSIEGLLAIYAGVMLVLGLLLVPETVGDVVLRRRAAALTRQTGRFYITSPIVMVLAAYMSFIYGTTYLLLAALHIVFQRVRGWSPGVGGLAFLPIAIGMLCATAFMVIINRQYARRCRMSESGRLPPEARLPSGKVGAVLLPVGLFLFAWTNAPSVPWVVCMLGTACFGFGNICVSLALVNYLVDSYVSYAASALAAATVLRSLCGAAFPLFTTAMYDGIGIHWASSVPAFLSLVCLPVPFLLSTYGGRIRQP